MRAALWSSLVLWTLALALVLPAQAGSSGVAGGSVDPAENGFRLTLTSGAPVTTADVASATAIYLTPYMSDRISLYNGASWDSVESEEVTYTLVGLTAETNYDLFGINSSGTVTFGTTAWTNATTRATALVRQDGVWSKTGALTQRYLGSFRTTSDTTTEDQLIARFLFNAASRRPRLMRVIDATGTWSYASATLRAARGVEANRLQFLRGLDEEPVSVLGVCASEAGADGPLPYIAIGLDRVGLDSQVAVTARHDSGGRGKGATASYEAYPSVGFHFLQWCEANDTGAGTVTWYGTTGSYRSGLVGEVWQ